MRRFSVLTLASLLTSRMPALVIDEIMYHPVEETSPGVEDKRYEWIELYNEHADPLDLSGYSFVQGIDFTFPSGTYLPGRAFAVVSASADALRGKYELEEGLLIFEWSPGRSLDSSGETVALANPAGLVEAKVSYNDRGRWPAGADGTGHTLALLSPWKELDDPDSWAISPTLGGSPGIPNFGGQVSYRDEAIVEDGEVWSYFKGTEAPPAGWRLPAFDDSGWPSGPTGIGYGDQDDRTVLTDMQGSYLTVFCRKRFTISDPARVDRLVLAITYDDGFYAFLNGSQVAGRNVTRPDWDVGAASAIEPTREEIDISAYKGLLKSGSGNVLAVQVHNFNLPSTDLSFIPRLFSRKVLVPPDAPTAPVVLNEGLLWTSGDRWIELFNRSDAAVDLSGFYLTDDRLDLEKAVLPPGTAIPLRGRRAFTDRELGLNFSLTAPGPRVKVFVALVNPQGTRVVDAYAFKPTVEERSEARVPDGDREMAPAAIPTRGGANAVELTGRGGIAIDEIMYHPISEDPSDEYIELYNRGPDTVDLGGFQLAKAVDFLFPEFSLAPGQYLVVARDPAHIAAVYGLPPERVLGPWYRREEDSQGHPIERPASLRDAGERITLLDPFGNVAATVRYADGGEWSSWADGGGSSLELIDPSQPGDTPQAWDASDESGKSAPAVFTYAGRHAGGDESEGATELQVLLLQRGIAVVDDISVRRGAVQYVVNGTFDDDASGWEMEGTHVLSGRTDDPALVLDGSGSLKVIATGSGDNKANHIEADLAERLQAYTPAVGVEYTISLTARWIAGSPALMTRGYNHGLARVHSLPLPARLGTPLARNSVTARRILEVGEANLGPVIDKVSFTPVVPEGGEAVTVTARIRDSDGVRPGSARVWYALHTPPPTSAGWTAAAMTGPDPSGRFIAVIPGQPLGTRVLFSITAEDASGMRNAGRYPLDTTRRTHPEVLDPSSPGPGDFRHVIYRHDVRSPATPYLGYRFVLDQAGVDSLWSRPALANDLVAGTFVFEAERAYPGVGIRWSGSPFLRGRSWGNSYRVRFPGDDLLHDRTRRMDLENHGTDGRERISHYLLRQANVPGVRVPYAEPWYARWQVNGDFSGVFEQAARPDKDFLRFWFPGDDEGELFKLDDRFEFKDGGGFVNTNARLTYPPYKNDSYPTPDPAAGYASWKENYRWFFDLESGEDRDDFAGLIGLSRLLDPAQVPDPAFDQTIAGAADIEEMLRVWAVRLNTDDWDTWGASRGKNAYLYRRPGDGRWVLLPWDMELTYQSVNSFPLGSNPSLPIPVSSIFPEVSRLLNRPFLKRRYYGILKEMVDRPFSSRFLSPWMGLLRANGTSFTEKGEPGNFIDQRAELIRAWIQPVVYPQQRLVVTSNGGNPFSAPGATVDISGNAPVEVDRIVVTIGGLPLDPQPEVVFSTTDMKGWKAMVIPLGEGVNRIGFHGFRPGHDDPVDEDFIDVTAGGRPAPVLTALSPWAAGPGDAVLLTGTSLQEGLKVYFEALESPGITFDPDDDPAHISAIVPAGLAEGPVPVKVKNPDSRVSNALELEVRMRFIRGDANLDSRVDLSDALKVLFVLYAGEVPGCREALDFRHDMSIDGSDVIGILHWLFLDGPPPEAPFPERGIDLSPETLGCERGL